MAPSEAYAEKEEIARSPSRQAPAAPKRKPAPKSKAILPIQPARMAFAPIAAKIKKATRRRGDSKPPPVITLPVANQQPKEVPPQGGPQGGPFPVEPAPKTAKKRRTKRAQSANEINIIEPNKATIRKELEHLKDYINADPYERVGMRPPSLVTASGRPKKRPGKKKNGGLAAILEHHDIKNDPYYMKPPLPTQMK